MYKKKNTEIKDKEIAIYSTVHVNRKVNINETIIVVSLTIYSDIDKVYSVYKVIPKGINELEIIELIIIKLMIQNNIEEIDKIYLDYPAVSELNIPSKAQIPFQFNEMTDKKTNGGQLLEYALTVENPKLLDGLQKEDF